jgi:hypothetical protein
VHNRGETLHQTYSIDSSRALGPALKEQIYVDEIDGLPKSVKHVLAQTHYTQGL